MEIYETSNLFSEPHPSSALPLVPSSGLYLEENHDYADFECDRPSHTIPGQETINHSNEMANGFQDGDYKLPQGKFLHIDGSDPITDKWLLEKILSIEKNRRVKDPENEVKLLSKPPATTETSLPPSFLQKPSLHPVNSSTPLPPLLPPPSHFFAPPFPQQAHPAPPPISTLTSLQKKQTSEGYSATLLLLFYTVGFIFLQVENLKYFFWSFSLLQIRYNFIQWITWFKIDLFANITSWLKWAVFILQFTIIIFSFSTNCIHRNFQKHKSIIIMSSRKFLLYHPPKTKITAVESSKLHYSSL